VVHHGTILCHSSNEKLPHQKLPYGEKKRRRRRRRRRRMRRRRDSSSSCSQQQQQQPAAAISQQPAASSSQQKEMAAQCSNPRRVQMQPLSLLREMKVTSETDKTWRHLAKTCPYTKARHVLLII